MRIPKQSQSVSRGRSTSQVDQGNGVVPQQCWCGLSRSWINDGQTCGGNGVCSNGGYVDDGNYSDGYDDPPYDPFPEN